MNRIAKHFAAAALAGVLSVPAVKLWAQAPATPATPAAQATAPINTLTEDETKAGFKLIFDGKTTDGWRNYKSKTISSGWTVVDGVLTGSGKGAGDIVTNDQYENFELLIDFRISKNGNSGIYYRCDESAATGWQTGVEMQVFDNGAGDPKGLHACGAAYELYGCSKAVVKPAEEWNSVRLVCNGPHIEHWINGEKVVEYDSASDDFKARVAKSKFKNPKFGTLPKGFICLQDHGSKVEFRNIKIRELPAK